MGTADRLFFAFLAAVAVFVVFVRLWKRPRQTSPGGVTMTEILRQVATDGLAGTQVDGGLRFVYRGLPGRLDFISDKTEIQIRTGNLLGQVVEVVPVGFPMSLFTGGGKDRLRARGSKEEYDRIFPRPADEQVLLEVGVAYDLRMSPDGVIMRFQSLPGSAAALRHWIACAFRIVDLIPGVENRVAGDTTCQICGASLAEADVVRCARCSTPHHEQCWDYTRRCSTFGCPSTRFVR
jgi:hypothetical protein